VTPGAGPEPGRGEPATGLPGAGGRSRDLPLKTSARLRLGWLSFSAAIVVLDLVTKNLAESILPYHGGTFEVIPGFLSMTLVHNTGAAFGLFANAEPAITTFVLNLIALGALLGVTIYSLRSPADRVRLQSGLALVLGGALGNLHDRLRFGHVVDFVEVYWRSFHWPNFNVADSAICVGVGLLVLDSFLHVETPEPSHVPAPANPEEEPCTRN
jgi:signal peptidase II